MSLWRFFAIASHAARLPACAILALIAFFASPSAVGSSITRFDALPRAGEHLAQPLWLPHCGMRIVEWRPTGSLRAETSPSPEALVVIDDTCQRAFARYAEFLRAQKLPRPRAQPDVLPAISLLPGNTLLDGKSPRALNDLPTRFEAVAPGCCYWGLYVDSLNHLFVRNDPLIRTDSGKLVSNPRFVRTLTHEISHVLSSRLGVWDVVGYDRMRDEVLAEAFVSFMGIGFPAESSAEDLALHLGPAQSGDQAAAQAVPLSSSALQAPSPSASANTSPQR